MAIATAERIAGAPISWGVCEVPGWGYQMDADRVLGEMRELGLTATEAGPDGFLAAEGASLGGRLARHGLRLVGGFVPLVLHRGDGWRAELRQVVERFATAGAEVVVLACATGRDGYDTRPVLQDAEWGRLLTALDEADAIARAGGLRAVLHPHVGTMILQPDEIDRVLAEARIDLCLDTGHIMAGGGDPVAIARRAPGRIGHVHFKDVRADLCHQVATGQLSFSTAVRDHVFCPLGEGDVDVAAIVAALASVGYEGWYVLEQDLVLEAEPPRDGGPRIGVAQSIGYLSSLLSAPD